MFTLIVALCMYLRLGSLGGKVPLITHLRTCIQNFPHTRHTNFQINATSEPSEGYCRTPNNLCRAGFSTLVGGVPGTNRFFPSSGFTGSDVSYQTLRERNLLLKGASIAMG